MKKNEKGFTLVELLAVIVILGLLMAIAIPSVTKYITQSRVKTLTTTMDSYITAVITQVNGGEYNFSDSSKIFAIPIECVSLEKGGESPFGNWLHANEAYWAYVLVQYDSENYNYMYGFTFKDDAGYGMYPTLNQNADNAQIKTGYHDLKQPKSGYALDFVPLDKWDGFNVTSTTKLVVQEAESDGVPGNGVSTCTLEQKGTYYASVDKDSNQPIQTMDGNANLNKNVTITDHAIYNEHTNTQPTTINGNGHTVNQTISSEEATGWNSTGNIANLGYVFSSTNGSKVTVNDLNIEGAAQSVSLGHYVSGSKAQQSNFNTELNNVNVIGLEVYSYSSGIAPAVVVYGTATLNNTNIYNTKLSSNDSYGYTVYDLAVVNFSTTRINGGRIGTIYTWAKGYLEINNAKVGTITTQIRKTSDWTNGNLIIGSGTTVDKILVKNANAVITIKSGAVVDTIDYNGLSQTNMTVVIEPGAVVKNIKN